MVVTDVGGLKETIGERGTGIVCEKAEPECVAEAIRSYFADPQGKEKFIENIRRENDRLSWRRFAADLTDYIKEIQQ